MSSTLKSSRLSKYLLALTLILITPFSKAADPKELFEQLKDSAISYETIGVICEQAARLQLQEQYRAPHYQIVNGIEYSDNNRTIGELDVAIFQSNNKKAVMLAEVKCWRNLAGGLHKAQDQRSRFIRTMKNERTIHFRMGKEAFEKQQFVDANEFLTIAQKGATSHGFDKDLNYSLDELMSVRDELIKCQSKGDCPKPKKSH